MSRFNKIFILLILSSLTLSSTINFSIDMNNLDFPNQNYDNVVVNGSWNSWNGWGVSLSDNNGDGIFQGSINLDNGIYEYVIALTGAADNWSGWGQIINAPMGSECDWNPNDEWANYGFSIENSNIEQAYCAGSCDDLCEGGNNNDSCEDLGLIECSDGSCEASLNDCDDGGGDGDTYELVWSDEFDGEQVDESKWNFESGNGNWGWGNGEHQYYRQENAFIEDGKLIIEARYESYGGFNYTSARMQTRNKGDWLYGKISARIKVPSAGGTWPAFWMMPTNSVYGGWPNSGEIDIMEHYGCDDNHVHATVHNNMYNWNGGIPPTSYSTYTNATSDFHIYEVEWNEDELNFYVDGEYLGTYFKTNGGWQQWPYDQEFYIILNLAIGSHFMACETENNLFPQQYQIDYVRVYQLSECLHGDISGEGTVDVIDIVQLVDNILNGDNSEFNSCWDLNGDGDLNIIDVVSLITLIIDLTH